MDLQQRERAHLGQVPRGVGPAVEVDADEPHGVLLFLPIDALELQHPAVLPALLWTHINHLVQGHGPHGHPTACHAIRPTCTP